MKSKAEIEQFIDDHLKDKDTLPEPGFTSDVLNRISEDRLEQEPVESIRFPWWFLVPLAAAIAIALLVFPHDPSGSKEIAANGVTTAPSEQSVAKPLEISFTEMEEILTLEESLRDFEILFDDNALEILALIDQ
ncbi:MAG: hypothetical protein VCA36_02105 [Opitutales bacterium]